MNGPVRAGGAFARQACGRGTVARCTVLGVILILASGCDKARRFAIAGEAASPPSVSPGEALDLASRPPILFEVFGDASDPRIIPLAVLSQSGLEPISLGADGWRRFNDAYLAAGASYTLYRDGRPVGPATVRRGMWGSDGTPLYTLPGCGTLVPQGAVTLDPALRTDFTVSYLAASTALGAQRPAPALSARTVAGIARLVALAAGRSAGVSRPLLDSLDFSAQAIATGASAAPTVVATFTDPRASSDSSSRSSTAFIFVIADQDATGEYRAGYVRVVNGPLAGASFRRYLDHLDVNGDGVDEIVVEAWRPGGPSVLVVLGYSGGSWREIFRARGSWCLDERNSD